MGVMPILKLIQESTRMSSCCRLVQPVETSGVWVGDHLQLLMFFFNPPISTFNSVSKACQYPFCGNQKQIDLSGS